MAIADQALRFVQQFARSLRLIAVPTRLLIVPATLCTITVAGCAQNTAQQGLEFNRVHVATRARHAQPRLRPLDRALLTPQPAPDCEFDRSDLKTVDPDQWARLKLDYERQCYQKAEKVARERLALLQRAVGDTHR